MGHRETGFLFCGIVQRWTQARGGFFFLPARPGRFAIERKSIALFFGGKASLALFSQSGCVQQVRGAAKAVANRILRIKRLRLRQPERTSVQ